MARQTQKIGELRNGLIRYVEGGTVHYDVRWRGVRRKGDTKCATFGAAKTWLDDEKQAWANEEHHPRPKDTPTLRELWQAWDESKADKVSASHRRYMRGVIHQHTGEWIDLPADQLNNAAIDILSARYLASTGAGHRRNAPDAPVIRKHSEGGWNKAQTQLSALVGWGVETGRLTSRPFAAKKLRVSLEARSVLWPEQVQAFLSAIDTGVRRVRAGDLYPHASIAVRLMLGLGLRESEAIHAEWDRVDFRRRVFIVAQAKTTGKKVKDRTIREIPIPGWLVDYLLAWWESQDSPSRGLVMVAKTGRAHTESSTKKALAIGAKRVSVDHLTPHALRRTFATVHWELGVPLTQIAQWLGHDDPALTYKRYILTRPTKDAAAAQDRAGKAMGFTAPIKSRQKKTSANKHSKKKT